MRHGAGQSFIAETGGEFVKGDRVVIAIRPERLVMCREASMAEMRNHCRGKITSIHFAGDSIKYLVSLPDLDVSMTVKVQASADASAYAVNQDVFLSWDLKHGALLRDD